MLCIKIGGNIKREVILVSPELILIDTKTSSFNLQAIRNRRFMYSPLTAELILGKQYRTLRSSHAEEHSHVGAKAPFDSFVRGWVGTGPDYPDGVIHFAPAVLVENTALFDAAFSTLEMFAENGANDRTIIRGFGSVWEQPLSAFLLPLSTTPTTDC